MRTALSVLLACLLLFSCALAEDSALPEEAVSEPRLLSLPLPIDFSAGCDPLESGFTAGEDGVLSYRDPTIQVDITFKDITSYQEQKKRTAGAWVVDIRIGDASQLRTAAAESFEIDNSDDAIKMAAQVHAVVATNGDYVTRLNNEGFVIRQGVLFRNQLKLKPTRDVLMVDEDGDFHVFIKPKKGELSDTVDGKKVLNAFYFGPVLVENGKVNKKMDGYFSTLEPDKYYTRLAICQVGPLHYKFIVTTNNQDTNLTSGLKLKAFAQLCKDEGAITAFNLDGGYSTTLYFNGVRVNEQKNVTFRTIPDIVYFASAWDGGDE